MLKPREEERDHSDIFELSAFTPYLLNQAAEAQSDVFSRNYRDLYGMLRTEWRVLFHLGRHDCLVDVLVNGVDSYFIHRAPSVGNHLISQSL